MEDLSGFVRFIHSHTSWTYEVMYDAYMIANLRKAKSHLPDGGPANDPEFPNRLDKEMQEYRNHIERIINRIERGL